MNYAWAFGSTVKCLDLPESKSIRVCDLGGRVSIWLALCIGEKATGHWGRRGQVPNFDFGRDEGHWNAGITQVNRRAMGIRLIVDFVLAIMCATGAYCLAADQGIPARSAIVLIALIAGCGWAMTGWIDTASIAFAGTLVVAVGVTTSMLISMAAVAARWWHPVVTVSALLAAAALANLLQAGRDIMRRSQCEH